MSELLTEAAVDLDLPVSAALLQKGPVVFSITGEQSVHRAISLMSEHEIGCLVVLNQQQKLVGLISERDYCRKVILMGRNSHGTQVASIMLRPVTTIQADCSLREAMGIMTEQRIRHMPVMDGDTVVGILSIGDVVKWALDGQSTMIRDLRDQLAAQTV